MVCKMLIRPQQKKKPFFSVGIYAAKAGFLISLIFPKIRREDANKHPVFPALTTASIFFDLR